MSSEGLFRQAEIEAMIAAAIDTNIVNSYLYVVFVRSICSTNKVAVRDNI
jgi:hypothetical protein